MRILPRVSEEKFKKTLVLSTAPLSLNIYFVAENLLFFLLQNVTCYLILKLVFFSLQKVSSLR